MNRIMLFLMIVTGISCSSPLSRNRRYDNYLNDLKKTVDYKITMAAFDGQANKMKDDGGVYYVFHRNYILQTVRDEALFFNTNHTKCLLLLLQQTDGDSGSDQIQIVQGTLSNKKWTFKLNRMPAVPNMLVSIEKKEEEEKRVNISISELSKEGRDFVLTAGAVSDNNIDIDKKYWFDDK